jgi:cobalamin biosynthesis protein CbiG
MNTKIIVVSAKSAGMSKKIQTELKESFKSDDFELVSLYKYKDEAETLQKEKIDEAFSNGNNIIFIGELSLCVKAISPYILGNDKTSVVCIDSKGKFIIPVVCSESESNDNDICCELVSILGATEVRTSQDNDDSLWELDKLAEQFGWSTDASARKKGEAKAILANQKPTALLLEAKDKGTEYLESNLPQNVKVFYNFNEIKKSLSAPKYNLEDKADSYDNPRRRLKRINNSTAWTPELIIIVSPKIYSSLGLPTLQFYPPVLHLGYGCQKQAPKEIAELIINEVENNGFSRLSLASVSTSAQNIENSISDEIINLCPTAVKKEYNPDELNKVEIPNPSEKVFESTGIYGVAEAAARLSGGNESYLVIEKQKEKYQAEKIAHFTYALAINKKIGNTKSIEIVGAGPGDPGLLSIRGKKFLENADLLINGTNKLPKSYKSYLKQGCIVRTFAGMELDELIELIKSFYDKGLKIVWLMPGAPDMKEQLQEITEIFDGMEFIYNITPGVPSKE